CAGCALARFRRTIFRPRRPWPQAPLPKGGSTRRRRRVTRRSIARRSSASWLSPRVVHAGRVYAAVLRRAWGIFPMRALSRRQQMLFHRVKRGLGARGDADLPVNVLNVVVRRLDRDIEQARDAFGGVPAREQPQYLDFAFGQSRHAIAFRGRQSVPGG